MKSTTLSLFSLLIFVFTSPSLSTSILSQGSVVVDAFGDPLEEGISYVVGPAIFGVRGGSIGLSAVSQNSTCKAYVVQDSEKHHDDTSRSPTPFTFRNIYPSHESFIKLGYPVAISSPNENPCEDDTAVWKVTDREDVTMSSKLITLGGQVNAETSCFRITKPEPQIWQNSYFIEHAPYLCNGPRVARRVGIYYIASESEYYLSTNDGPEQYVFVPRPSIESVTTN